MQANITLKDITAALRAVAYGLEDFCEYLEDRKAADAETVEQ